MKFNSLRVSNLKAIRLFEVDEIGDFAVIAGPNGCGKSCVFDAIRLLKSLYGGHSTDEHMQWFAEFAINVQDRSGLRAMFRDPQSPIEAVARVEFDPSEADFLRDHARDLLLPIAWQRVTGQRMDHWSFNRMAIATQLAQNAERLEHEIDGLQAELRTELDTGAVFELAVTISPEGLLNRAPCLAAEVSFQAFEPEHLGIIEFHSASRTYSRQPLSGINLDSKEFENQRRQSSLYNWQNKYQNVKSELAAGYLRSLIAEKFEEEDGDDAEAEDLNETLKELFRTFFPDKEYLGVRPAPGGSLEFPVRLPGGETHDIDDLSSGEKEILYGYLRLRNSTPKRSVILLDEPELHLNPSLLQGFADFYSRHLGVAQGNQLWMVTHSDTLLRQAIGNSNYRVFHMLSAASSEGNQASEVLLDDDLEKAVVELVGDLAAYRPHAKVVILEGDGEDGFDEQFLRRLYPNFAKRVNLVSARSKRHVRDLFSLLEGAMQQIEIGNRFFAIVDADAPDIPDAQDGAAQFRWDVYHVENFLLDPQCVREAANSLLGREEFTTDESVTDALKDAAESIIDELVLKRIRREFNSRIISCIDLAGPPVAEDIAGEVYPAIERSYGRLDDLREDVDQDAVAEAAERIRDEFRAQLESGDWVKTFPGRTVLKRFAGNHMQVGYVAFRNVILDKMASNEVRPGGVGPILDEIIAA